MPTNHTLGTKKSVRKNKDCQTITAIIFPEYERLSFTPQLFGPELMLMGESLVFDLHNQMTGRSYSGHWEFYKLSNGGFYMAPEGNDLLRITWPGNRFDDVMSSDAAGIVMSLFALNIMAFEFHNSHLPAMVFKLEDFARGHAESSKIRKAID